MDNKTDEVPENEGGTKAITVQVYGQVQGVLFRVWAKEQAEELTLKGWVRNRVDLHVEIHLEGLSQNVDSMVQLLKRGSSSATVSQVILDEAPFVGFPSFEIKETV